MRELKFIVDQQLIRKDPDCSFSNIIAGTANYLQLSFSFDQDWEKCKKVIVFSDGAERLEANTFTIPKKYLGKMRIQFYLVGQYGDTRITTNTIQIRQFKGGNL